MTSRMERSFRMADIDTASVLRQEAPLPLPSALVSWKSGVLHFAQTGNQNQLMEPNPIICSSSSLALLESQSSPVNPMAATRKRSACSTDLEFIQTLPPALRTSTSAEVTLCNMIESDKHEKSTNITSNDVKISTSNKGKAVESVHNINNVDEISCDDSEDIEDYDNNYMDDMDDYYDSMVVDDLDLLQEKLESADVPPGVEASLSWMPAFSKSEDQKEQEASSSWFLSHGHKKQFSKEDGNTSSVSKGGVSDEQRDELLRKLVFFKQFDVAEDCSDHCYFKDKGSSSTKPPKSWAKRIQEEWAILQKDLPATIFVRVYESRMDLLRAVIIGAEGTPYHDGLFFFDLHFPNDYPNVPPRVKYDSHGLRMNPNLYECGKVCLSLLGTWTGKNKNEKWIPGVSTVLQVLISIQALILNTEPYFNEPGYEKSTGTTEGQRKSELYNEEKFILSLKTMMYKINTPPKHFEDFIAGHFYNRAHDILGACKAYMEGAQVGSLVKGVAEGDKKSSINLKNSLLNCMERLVQALTKVGAKNCEKFLPAKKPLN